MASKLETFTQRARTVLQFAQEEAELMHLDTIGTEHVLLGLVREEQRSQDRCRRCPQPF